MSKTIPQTSKKVLSNVSKLVFTNPFSKERLELDKQITGKDKTTRIEDLLLDVIHEVEEHIKLLDKDSKSRLEDFQEVDREMMKC